MFSFDKLHDTLATLEIRNKSNQKLLVINVSLLISAFELKKEIETDLKLDDIKLIYDGRFLNDYFTLLYQGIRDRSIIFAILNQNKIQNEPEECDNTNKNTISTDFLNVLTIKENRITRMRAKIKLHFLIEKMDNVFTNNAIYIFNGIILDKKKSFNDYNIENDDTLIILQSENLNTNTNMVKKWLKLSQENGRFQSYINLKSFAIQSSRLSDIRFNNMELKRKQIRFNFNENNIKNNFSNYSSGNKTILITNYNPISTPSVSPLPELDNLI